jgi:hypothetical protein
MPAVEMLTFDSHCPWLLLVPGCRASVVGHWLLLVGGCCWFLVVRRQLLGVGYCLSVVVFGSGLSGVRCWALAVACRCRLLAHFCISVVGAQ